MTPTEIQNLSGVELALEVAEKVMGWNFIHLDFDGEPVFSTEVSRHKVFQPDRDGGAMLEVVERMRRQHHFVFTLRWNLDFMAEFRRGYSDFPEVFRADGDTAPEAVCRASLLALLTK